MLGGLGSFAFAWSVGVPGEAPDEPLTPLGLVHEAGRLGAEVLQLADNVAPHALAEDDLIALRGAAAAHGVRLELGARGLTPAHLERCVEVAQRLGCGLVRFVVDDRDHAPPPAEIEAILRAAVPSLSRAEVVIAVENHDRLTARELAAVVRHVDDERVGICLDTVNSLGRGEGLDHVVDVLAGETLCLHVKDFRITRREHGMGFTVEGAPLGSGMLDLAGVLEAVAAAGRCRSAVLEQWAPRQATLEATVACERRWAADGYAVLRGALRAVSDRQPREGAKR